MKHSIKHHSGGCMPLGYCRLHQRLFSQRYAHWVTFSHKTIDALRGYGALLHTTHAECSHLAVMGKSCNQCEATLGQRAQVNGSQGGLLRASDAGWLLTTATTMPGFSFTTRMVEWTLAECN